MHRKFNKQVKDWSSIFQARRQIFQKELDSFERLIRAWRQNQGVKSCHQLVQYVKYIKEANTYYRLKGQLFIKPIKNQSDFKHVSSQIQMFIGTKFLQQKAWKVHFSSYFIQKIQKLHYENIKKIFLKIYALHEGYLNFNEQQPNCLRIYNKKSKFVENYYTTEIQIDQKIHHILLSVSVQRVPFFSHSSFSSYSKMKVQCYQYIMMLTFQNIIQEPAFYNKKKMSMIMETIEKEYQFSLRLNYRRDQLVQDKREMNQKFIYYHERIKVDQEKAIQIYPTLYKKTYPNQADAEKFNYAIESLNQCRRKQQFLSNESNNNKINFNGSQEQTQQEQAFQFFQTQVQKCKNTLKFQNSSKILTNIQKTPNFKYSLTNQQREILSQEGNLIIIGRSGTGKTTCAMLRLYGIEFVIKFNEISCLKRQGLLSPKLKCTMVMVNQIKLVKNMFLTFSAKLIDEIKRQYNDMLYQIQQKHSFKCVVCKNNFTSNKIFNEFQEDPLDKRKRKQEQQQQKVNNLNLIDISDFPCFFTIQNFIKSLDRTIFRPFFCYLQNKQSSKPKNLEIKRNYINRYGFNEKGIDIIEAIEINYDFFKQHIWKKISKQYTKYSKQYCLLTPSIIWSQIFSIIKGSINSYTCPGGYLSYQMYIDSPHSIFHRQGQKMFFYKKAVYKIFKIYFNFCHQEAAYDLMDVVNHILSEIEKSNTPKPMINYMFIDEVQDLTTSTTYLLSRMVINNVFYCGDTAQAIVKGVSFKFEDLQFIFNKDYCKNAIKLQSPKKLIHLTVNFRSHNYILQLGNSIVLALQNLFPNSINKLQRQKSDLFGPKPFLIHEQSYNQQILFQLICGKQSKIEKDQQVLLNQFKLKSYEEGQNSKDCKNTHYKANNKCQSFCSPSISNSRGKFNSEQIIIVRNKQQQAHLPINLKQGIVLTPQSVKGLQYDEVILYNFFSSCPFFDQWDHLLQYLQPSYSYQSQQDFETQLSRRNLQQKGINQQLELPIKILLGYDPQINMYRVWTLKTTPKIKQINLSLYHQLIHQLKILYTAITRARSVFVIYDKKIPRNLYRLWNQLNLIKCVHKDNINQCFESKSKYVQKNEKHSKYLNWQAGWYKAGEEMLARKDRTNAKKCYANIGRFDLVERIEAQQLQIKAQSQLFKINNLKKNIKNLSREEKKILNVKLQKQREYALILYKRAAEIYQTHNRYNDAAEAFFNAKLFQNSLKYYTLLNKADKIAECQIMLGNYQKAINFFLLINDAEKIIKSYIQQRNWVSLIGYLASNPKNIELLPPNSEIDIYYCIKKALNSIIHLKIQQKRFKTRFYHQQLYPFQEDTEIVKKICTKAQWICLKKLRGIIFKIAKNEGQLKITEKLIMTKLQQQQIKKQKLESQLIKIYKHKEQIQDTIQQIKYNISKSSQKKVFFFFSSQMEIDQRKKIRNLQLRKMQIKKKQQEFQQEFRLVQFSIKQLTQCYDETQNQMSEIKKNQSQKLKLILELQKRCFPQIQRILAKTSQQSLLEKPQLAIFYQRDIYSMKQIWNTKKANICGFNFLSEEKRQIFEQLIQVNKKSQRFVSLNNKIEPKLSHKYIQQKILKQFSHSFTIQEINIIKICSTIDENMVGMFVCDYFQNLISLSPRFIIGYLAKDSQNFMKKRHFKQQIYQLIIQRNRSIMAEEFISRVNSESLLQKVPRVGFENTFFCQTFLSQLAFGLILLGYFKQALKICKLGLACKLAYLYSSYDELVNCIKDISSSLRIQCDLSKKYLFVESQVLFQKFPEASMLNIFSYQNIFYTYDECQQQPFLSKKRTAEQIDIDQKFIQQCYLQVSKKVRKIIEKKQLYKAQIRQLSEEIKHYQLSLRKLVYKEMSLIQTYEVQLSYLHLKLGKLQQILRKTKDKCKKVQHQQMNLNEYQEKIAKFKKEDNREEVNRWQKKKKYYIDQQKYKMNKQNRQSQQNKEQEYDKNKQINKIQTQMILNDYRLQLIKGYQNKSQVDFQKIEKYFKKVIQQNQQKIEKIQQENIWRDSQKSQIYDQQIKIIIRYEKQKRHKRLMQMLRETNMKDILNNSNIPNSQHFLYLNLYIRKQLKVNSKQNESRFREISKIYQTILTDGISIEQLQKQELGVKSIKNCNIILFYLSFIFNKEICYAVIDFVKQAALLYENKSFSQKNIKIYQRNLQYYKTQLAQRILQKEKIENNKFYPKLQEDIKTYEQKIIFDENKLREIKGFKQDPHKMLQSFLNSLYRKIKTLKISQVNLMELIFGFFQCRMIRDCEILGFIANEYILVRQNSIVIKKLQESKKYVFAYYFDQQNTTILCRFQDVQQVILGLIQQSHKNLYRQNEYFKNKEIENEKRKKYLDRQILGYKKNIDAQQNKQILKLTQQAYPLMVEQIKYIYENAFTGGLLMRELKQQKQKAIEYLLKHEYHNSQSCLFAMHQIRELHFLEKMIQSIKIFNYQILKEVNQRKEMLIAEFQRYNLK